MKEDTSDGGGACGMHADAAQSVSVRPSARPRRRAVTQRRHVMGATLSTRRDTTCYENRTRIDTPPQHVENTLFSLLESYQQAERACTIGG